MNIALTGSSGFLGRHFFNKSNKEFKVISWNKQEMDIFKPETLKNFLQKKSVVIHLAGVNKNGNIRDIVKVNILGTKRLLDGISRYCPDANLIFASSFQVYDDKDIFGISKQVAEELIEDYVTAGSIKKAIILRFSNIYGPGGLPFRNSAISTFVYLIKKGEEIVVNGTGEQKRDFIFIDDAISALKQAINLDLKKGYKTFNVSSGRLTSINEIIEIMKEFSDKKVLIRYNEQNHEVKIVSERKITERLPGWHSKVTLEQGIRKLMNDENQ